MKLCIDCKHHRVELYAGPGTYEDHFCYAHVNLVTGAQERRDCHAERQINATGCRPEGRLWEGK